MTDCIKKSMLNQIISFRASFAQDKALPFNEILGQNELFQMIQEESGSFRDRIFSPMVTLTTFISQALSSDYSCREAVAKVVVQRLAQHQPTCSSNSGPYCRARQRLSGKLLIRLALHTGQNLHQQTVNFWNWKGRAVKLIDGTTLSMPDTPKNQHAYPQSKSQKPGLGFPKIRLVAMLSLCCGTLVDFATGPCLGKNTGEHALLRQILGSLTAGDVLVADRYYGSYFLIAELMRRGIDGLFKLHAHRKDSQRTKRFSKDQLVVWSKPQRPDWMDQITYDQVPKQINLRQTRIKGKVFISTFLNFKTIKRTDIFQLYSQRWQIELDLRSIKTVLQMDILRCKTPQMVLKEISVHLLAYNLIRTIIAQAAYRHHRPPRLISFKATLQLLAAFVPVFLLKHQTTATFYDAFFTHIVLHRVGQRPGRLEPRALKRRLKQYALLTQPRSVTRNRLSKQFGLR